MLLKVYKKAKSYYIMQLETKKMQKLLPKLVPMMLNFAKFCRIFKAILMRPWNLEYFENLVY